MAKSTECLTACSLSHSQINFLLWLQKNNEARNIRRGRLGKDEERRASDPNPNHKTFLCTIKSLFISLSKPSEFCTLNLLLFLLFDYCCNFPLPVILNFINSEKTHTSKGLWDGWTSRRRISAFSALFCVWGGGGGGRERSYC